MNARLRVGFIGLGVMGRSMAANVKQAGFPVMVWNRTTAKMDEAAAWGAETAASPREVAQNSDVVITMVGDTADVFAVLKGPDGVLAGGREGMIIIDMSTIAPQGTRELAELAAQKGIKMLDAPVSGGDIGAQKGTLSIMVGGSEEALQAVHPILQAMGKNIVHCGPVGAGQTVKACNQILGGLNLLGMVEALAFAKKANVDLDKMLAVTSAGAASSWALQNLAPRVIRGDLDPGFSVKFQQKDLRIVLQEAEQMELPLLGTAVVSQLLRSLQAYGEAEDGTHALIRVMERLANLDIVPKAEPTAALDKPLSK